MSLTLADVGGSSFIILIIAQIIDTLQRHLLCYVASGDVTVFIEFPKWHRLCS